MNEGEFPRVDLLRIWSKDESGGYGDRECVDRRIDRGRGNRRLHPGRHQSEQLVQHHRRQNVRLGEKATPLERRSADRRTSANPSYSDRFGRFICRPRNNASKQKLRHTGEGRCPSRKSVPAFAGKSKGGDPGSKSSECVRALVLRVIH